MYLIDKLYDALGIKENKIMYRRLIINYSSFVLLFIIVGLVVKMTTKLPERKIDQKKVMLSPTRKEEIINKVRNSPMRLQTKKKIMLSESLS
jgi:hypothetical protein|tara:strand:+ start:226 stop:501 length:276 start_codon:yes stop_codon:yes gene_type:complete